MPNQSTITFASYRVPIYTPGWRAAMQIKCLAEGHKCRAAGSNPGPRDWKTRALPIVPRHLHNEPEEKNYASVLSFSASKK